MSYYIRQIGERDCAFASLKMLLSDCLKNKNYLFFPQHKINDYYSLQEIIDIAKNEGVILRGYKYKVKEEIISLKEKALVILREKSKLHMVYLVKINRFYATFMDPKRGKIRLRTKDFIETFNGEVLEIKEIKKKEVRYKRKRIIPLRVELFISFIQTITYLLFFSGLYFIDQNVTFLVPLLLFLSFILMAVVLEQVMIKIMKRYDFMLFDNIYNAKGKFKQKYIDVMVLKKLIFSLPLTIVSTIMMIIFSLIILGINSYLNLIAIGILFVFSFFFNLIYQKVEKRSHQEVSLLEDEMFKKEDNFYEMRASYKLLNEKTYNYIKLVNLKKYIFIFISIIISLILASFENTIYLNFVLFHTFIYYFIADNFTKILNVRNDFNDLNYYKCIYFYNSSI